MNIAELVHAERLSATAFFDLAYPALKPYIDAAQAARAGFGQREFLERLRFALPAALDIALAEIIAGGWRSCGPAPSGGVRIRSTHNSAVDILAGDQLLARIGVQARVTLDLRALRLALEGNTLATDGEALAGARISCADMPIFEEAPRPVAIPRKISLTP